MKKRAAEIGEEEYLDQEDHHVHEGLDDDRVEKVVKKEVMVVEDEQSNEWPAPKDSSKSIEDNLELVLLPNSPTTQFPSSPSPSSTLGRRKRKPKQTYEEEIDQIKKKKKNTSARNSKSEGHDFAGKNLSCKQESVDDKVMSPTLIRAEEVRLSLGPEAPCFAKVLVRSHVASCFWMGLPGSFCKSHLPMMDSILILEDENGEQYEVKYIAEKPGLSAGWRKFAVGHKLLLGDVLVFHLVGSKKFKVYIVRANDLNDVDGALSLLDLDTKTEQNDAETVSLVPKNKKKRCPKSLPLDVVQKKNKKTGSLRSMPQIGNLIEQSGNDSEEVGSEVVQVSGSCAPALCFKDVKSFEDFHIVVNGSSLDSELSDQVRIKYYELCRSKNAFLHDRLLPGLYSKLVAGIIFEIVNIVDSMRACNLKTSREEFATWDKSLKSFELLGMNIGFLRSRLRRLLNLAFDSEGASDTRKYLEAIRERDNAENEIRNIEARLAKLKEASQMFDADIQSLKVKAETHELKFQEEVKAPW